MPSFIKDSHFFCTMKQEGVAAEVELLNEELQATVSKAAPLTMPCSSQGVMLYAA